MPKNVKRQKKSDGTTDQKYLLLKNGDEQNYGLILKEFGNLRFKLMDPKGVEHLGILRGKMRGRQRIRVGDVIVFSYREMTEERKVDIIQRYTPDQAKRVLKAEGISFPEQDKAFSWKAEFVFENDYTEEPDPVQAPRTTSGRDRIAAIYQDQSDSESDYEICEEDEDDGGDDEAGSGADGGDGGDGGDEADEAAEDKRVDKRHKIDHRRHLPRGDFDHPRGVFDHPRGVFDRPTAASMLTGVIDIDAI